MKKRLLSTLLALSMLVGMVPTFGITAAAADTTTSADLPVDSSTYSDLGLSIDENAAPDTNYPYSNDATTPLYVASEVYVAANGSSGNVYTVRDGLNRMYEFDNYTSDLQNYNSFSNNTGGLSYYDISSDEIDYDNGNSTGSLLSSNTFNSLQKDGNGFSGIYATSTAFNAGEGQDNYIAELRAYGESGTYAGNVTIAIFRVDSNGTRTLIDEELMKNDAYNENYFARRYASELEGVFEIEVADIDGDGVDEIFIYGCDYSDQSVGSTTNRYAVVEQWNFTNSSLSFQKQHIVDCGYFYDYNRNMADTNSNQGNNGSYWYRTYAQIPILTIAAGDLDGDFKEEVAFTISVPNTHDSTDLVGHTYVYTQSGNSTEIEQIIFDSSYASTESVKQTGGIQLVKGVSQNNTIGTFADPSGSGSTIQALLIAGYGDGDGYAYPSYSGMLYRYVYYDSAAGEYVVSDMKTQTVGTAAKIIIDSAKMYDSEDSGDGEWNAIPAPIPLASAQMEAAGTDSTNNDEVLLGGDIYRFNLTDGVSGSKIHSLSVYSDQVNSNNNNKNKNLIWIGDVEVGVVDQDADGNGWRESFLYVLGVHRDDGVNEDDDYYWMDLGGSYMMDSGTIYSTQEGVIAESNRRNDQYGTFISLALPDIDSDSILLKYVEAYSVFTDPEVYAVLQANPFFTDLSEIYDYPGDGATTFEQTESSTLSGGFNVSQELGVYMAEEVEVGASAEASAEVVGGVSYAFSASKTVEYTQSYVNSSGEDMVVVYTIPYTYYVYEMYDPDTEEWEGAIFPVAKTPVTAMLSVEQYDEIASQTAGLDVIAGNILYNTPGEPDTYSNSLAGENVYDFDNYSTAVSTAGGTIEQEISVTSEMSHEIEVYMDVNTQVGAGAGLLGNSVTAGVVTSRHTGLNIGYSSSEGTTFIGAVDNIPAEATNYGMSWKLRVNEAELNGSGVWVVGYDVKDVSQPPRMPQNLSVDAVTANSVSLIWESSDNVVYYEIFVIDTSTGDYNSIATVPYTSTSYVDTNVEPSSTYSYSVQAVSALQGTSVYSPAVTVTTFTDSASFEITAQPENSTTYPGGTAEFTVGATYISTDGSSKDVSYLWQKYEDDTWVTLTNLDNLDGYNTKTLEVDDVTSDMDGDSYRCRVYYSNRSIYSTPAEIDVSKESSMISMSVAGLTEGVAAASGTYDAVTSTEDVVSYSNISVTDGDNYYTLMSDGTNSYWYDGTSYYSYEGETLIIDEDNSVEVEDGTFDASDIGEDPITVTSGDPTMNVTTRDYSVTLTVGTDVVTFDYEDATVLDSDEPTGTDDTGIEYTATKSWTNDSYTLYEMSYTADEYTDDEGETIPATTYTAYFYSVSVVVDDTDEDATDEDATDGDVTEEDASDDDVTDDVDIIIFADENAVYGYTEHIEAVSFTGAGTALSESEITVTDEDEITYTAKTSWTSTDSDTTILYYMESATDDDGNYYTAYYYSTDDGSTLTACSPVFSKYLETGVATTDLSQVTLKTTSTIEHTTTVDADTDYLTFTATVSVDEDAAYSDGAVTFYVSGAATTSIPATYSNGKYTATWQPTAEGSYTVYAVYGGNSYYFGSSSFTNTFDAAMSFDDVTETDDDGNDLVIDHTALILSASATTISYGSGTTLSVLGVSSSDGTSDETNNVDTKYVVKILDTNTKNDTYNDYVDATEGTDYYIANNVFYPMAVTKFTIQATNTTSESDLVTITCGKGSLTLTAVDQTAYVNSNDDDRTATATISGYASWDESDVTALDEDEDYRVYSTGETSSATGNYTITVSWYGEQFTAGGDTFYRKSTDVENLEDRYSLTTVNGTYTLEGFSYSLNISSATNGTMSATYQSEADGVSISLGDLTELPGGYSVTVTAAPAAGYVISGWLVNGSYVTENGEKVTDGTYIIEDLDQDYEISVEYKQGSNTLIFGSGTMNTGASTVTGYYLTSTGGSNGTISSGSAVNYLNNIRLVANPAEGYAVDYWTVSYGGGEATTILAENLADNYTGETYDLSQINSNVTVTVYFVKEETIQVTINPVNGTTELDSATVTVNGTVLTERTDLTDGTSAYVYEGTTSENLTIVVTPPGGLLLNNWSVEAGQTTGAVSTTADNNDTMTIYNLREAVDFTVDISGLNSYGVVFGGAMDEGRYSADTVGTVTAYQSGAGYVENNTTLDQGSTITFTATANPGYEVIGWTLNGEEVSGSLGYGEQEYQVASLDGAGANVVVTFRMKPVLDFSETLISTYSVVAWQDGTAVTIDADSTYKYVDYSSDITVTATPVDASTVLTSICEEKVNEDLLTGTMSITLTGIEGNTAITSNNTDKPTVSVATLPTGVAGVTVTGTQAGSTNQTITNGDYVDYDTEIEVVATPATGYVITAISYGEADGQHANNTDNVNGAVTFLSSVASDITLTVTAEAKPIVTITQPANGAITATGTVDGKEITVTTGDYVDFNTTVTYTVTPAAGYVVDDDLFTNGVKEFTTETITANATVSCDCIAKPIVTITQPANGAITATGTVDGEEITVTTGDYVDFNTTVTYTVTPAAGYVVDDDLFTNGAKEFTTETITANATVSCDCIAKPIVTITQPANGAITATGTVDGEEITIATGDYVDFNTTVTYTVTPAAGYVVDDDLFTNGAKEFTTDALTADETISELCIAKPEVAVTSTANVTITAEATQDDTSLTLAEGDTDYVDFTTDVIITADPDAGYVVTAISVNGVVVESNPNKANGVLTYTIDDIDADAVITVAIDDEDGTEEKPNVTVAKSSNVTITATSTKDGAEVNFEENGSGYVDFYLSNTSTNNSVEIVAEPEDGYVVTAVSVNDNVVASNYGKNNGNLTYTIENISTDATITVTTVEKADIYVYDIDNGTVEATFEQDDDDITIGEGAGNADYIDFNADITVNLAPDYAYEVSEDGGIRYTSEANSDNKSYTIHADDVDPSIEEIDATFVKIPSMTLEISVKDKDGADDSGIDGVLTAVVERKSMDDYKDVDTSTGDTDTMTVYRDSTITLIAVPDEGYRVYKWFVDGDQIDGTTAPSYTITSENPDDIEIQVQFIEVGESILYSVSDVTGEATISAVNTMDDSSFDYDTVVIEDSTLEFTVDDIARGYHLASWSVNGEVVEGETDETFEYDAEAGVGAEIVATIARDSYEVTFEAENGTITASNITASGDEIVGDSEVTFTATPDVGYEFESWIVDGEDDATTGDLTLTITADTEVSATFVLVASSYTVTYGIEGEENGTITASDSIASGDAVDSHEDVTFTAEPAEGYQVKSWYYNNDIVADSAETSTYEVIDLVADATVKVEFEAIPTYTVTLSAGANGSVTATVNGETVDVSAGALTASRHDEVVITAVPEAYYSTSAWTVDGTLDANIGNSYTISDLLTDTSVAVDFTPAGMALFTANVVGENGTLTTKSGDSADTLIEIHAETDAYVLLGNIIEMTATPAAGYMVKEWIVNGVIQDNLSNSFIIESFGGRTVVTVEYEAQTLHAIPETTADYTISDVEKTPTDYGTATQIRDRGDVTFTVTPVVPDGSYVSKLEIGGVNLITSLSEDITSAIADTMSYVKNEDGSYTITLEGVTANVEIAYETLTFQVEITDMEASYTYVDADGITQTVTSETVVSEFTTEIKNAIGTATAVSTQEVKLQVSNDGGNTWYDATADHFPAEGITITLDLPAALDGKTIEQLSTSNYEFAVVHYIVSDINGDVPGTTETFTIGNGLTLVTKDDGNVGVELTVYSLSPFAVAYQYTTTSSGSSGGGYSVTTTYYDLAIADTENGTVTATADYFKSGADVVLTITPDEGYAVSTILVVDADGDEVLVTDNTFAMPANDVEVTVTFAKIFTDVDADAYYYDAVLWAADAGVTAGKTDTTFAPWDINTRAEAVTFLYRAMGEPDHGEDCDFTDIMEDSFYYEAVLWAAENDITMGTSDTTFSPNMDCSRAHIITLLWRMMGEPVVNSINPFTDVTTSNYYYDAVLWAVGSGITSGTTDTTFSPDQDCTRAEIVTFLYRALAE